MWAVSKAQSFYPRDTTVITVGCGPTGQTTKALFTLPPHYNENSSKYGIWFSLPGLGEGNGPASILYNNTTAGLAARVIYQGLMPATFHNYTTGTDTAMIFCTPYLQAGSGPSASGSISAYQLSYIIQYLLSHYRVDASRIYVSGISAGGQGVVDYAGNVADQSDHGPAGNPVPTINNVAAYFPMEAEFSGSRAKAIADTVYSRKVGFFPIGSPGDSHSDNTFAIGFYLNGDSAGSVPVVTYRGSTVYGIPYGTGQHCCWDTIYNPTFKFNYRGHSMSIYEAAQLYTNTNFIPSPNPIVTPIANATIYLNKATSSTVGASVVGVAGATITSVVWTNTSKPSGAPTPTIVSPNLDTTNVTGLTSAGTYVFNILATDNNGLTANANDTVFVKAGCGGVKQTYTITADDQGKFITMTSPLAISPGDTLIVAGGHRWAYFSGDGLHGTQSCPFVVINDPAYLQIEMTAGIAFTNSTYVHVTGTGNPSTFYGFYIHSYDSVNPVSRGNSLQFSARSAHCEVDHIDEYARTYCMWLKNEADCQDSINNWRLDDFQVHDIRAKNINQDGFYLGSTGPEGGRSVNCASVNYFPVPSRLSNIRIWNIILDSVGRSGIQMSGADSGSNKIYNCNVRRTGYELNPQQGSGIIIGGHSQVYVHDNKVRCTFQLSIWDLGSGLSRIENNDCDSSGHIYSPTSGADTTNPNYVPIGSDTRPTVQLWPNDSLSASGLGPLLSRRTAPTLAILTVKGNKVGIGTFLPIPGLQIDIWPNSSASLIGIPNQVCSNVMQNGVTPAFFRVNSNVTYLNGCGQLYIPRGAKIIAH